MPYCAPVTVYVVMPPASLSATMTMMPGPAIAITAMRLHVVRESRREEAGPDLPSPPGANAAHPNTLSVTPPGSRRRALTRRPTHIIAQNRARIPRLDKNSLLHLHCAQKIVPDASASVHRQPRGGIPAELLGVERLDELVALSPALRRFDPQLEVDPRPQERLDLPPGPLPNGLEHPAIPADQHLLVGL